jgi:hypothetical protein
MTDENRSQDAEEFDGQIFVNIEGTQTPIGFIDRRRGAVHFAPERVLNPMVARWLGRGAGTHTAWPNLDDWGWQPTGNPSPLATDETWEYQTHRDIDENTLTELGKQGWELAAVFTRDGTERWVFKRRKH